MNGKTIFTNTVLRNGAWGRVISVGLFIIMATGCGGGGGGGSSVLPGIAYDGNTDPAAVTTTNAATLVNNVVGAGDAANAIVGPNATSAGSRSGVDSAAPSQGIGLSVLARRLVLYLQDSLAQDAAAPSQPRVAQAAIPVNETVFCDEGSVRLAGTLDDNGRGTLTVNYSNCRIEDARLNGRATMRIDVFDLSNEILTDMTIRFQLLTLVGPGFDVSSSGSVRSVVDLDADTTTLTARLVTRDNITGRKTKSENLTIVIEYDNILGLDSSFSETITGRVFDSVHGFVDIETDLPLFFSAPIEMFPESGQLTLTGELSAERTGYEKIKVIAVSPEVVHLELDLDGDDVYEITVVSRWVHLADEVNDDLGDEDTDGMHNSWETFYGLDPSDAADADADADTDGSTNLDEYLAGTDPTDAGDFPTS